MAGTSTHPDRWQSHDTLAYTGYASQLHRAPIKAGEPGKGSGKGGKRKFGRMKRKGGWAFDGGPVRMAARKRAHVAARRRVMERAAERRIREKGAA